MLEKNALDLTTEDLVDRVKAFCNHVQRESHCDPSQHEAELNKLEVGFHSANDEQQDPSNIYLSLRPQGLFATHDADNLWSGGSMEASQADADRFKQLYAKDAQFIFSRCQHHWHGLNNDGERVPLAYCKCKGSKVKKHICKQNFPRRVAAVHRQKTRLVCRGIAAELQLRTSGRRNMLGSIASERNEPWFASCAKVMSVLMRSNTNLQCHGSHLMGSSIIIIIYMYMTIFLNIH